MQNGHPWAPKHKRLNDEDVALLLLAGEGEGGYYTQESWNPLTAKIGDLFISQKIRVVPRIPGDGIIIYRLRDNHWEIVYMTGGKPNAKPAR